MRSSSIPHAPSLPRNQSLQRAASLLWALAERPAGSSAAELSRATGLPAPTTGRLLATLADLGLADVRKNDSQWVLGSELTRLARLADPFATFVDRAQPHLAELAIRTGESATISHARPPHMAVVIAQADAPRFVGMTNWLARGFSMHASAVGKLALALALDDDAVRAYAEDGLDQLTPRTVTDPSAFVKELARVRKRGYATTVDELEEGHAATAILLAELDSGLLLLAISGPSSRFDVHLRREVLPMLREFADRIRPLL